MFRMVIAVVVAGAAFAPGAAAAGSLRFFGTGTGDIDRVKVRIDNPADSRPGPRADVGARDFTIELWLRGTRAENRAGAVACGANVSWINGNIVVDRDRYNRDRKFGLSIAGGRLVWGVSGAGTGDGTLCGRIGVLDGRWHHVAVQRRRADGRLEVWVDGRLDVRGDGPGGDVSYPDAAVPGPFCGGPCTRSDPFLVIAAEKHDAGGAYPSFAGWIDEVRISTRLRYKAPFTPRRRPFAADPSTVLLLHFDERSGTVARNAAGGPNGVIRRGGPRRGPAFATSTPLR